MKQPKRTFSRHALIVGAVLLLTASLTWAGDDEKAQSDITKRIDAAAKVLNEIMATPDKAIPNKVMSDAKCIAVIPSMVKIAVGFGGSHGKGVATCRTDHGWSAPAFFDVEGGNWGLQIGAEGIDVVMVIQNDHGMQRLLGDKFELGADASVAAGPVGRHASADTDWKLNDEILTYSRAKGIFAGLTLNGAAVHQDHDAMRAFYGHDVGFREVLYGHVPPPPEAMGFLNAVREAREQARDAHAER
jgi:SH3 domain-containing YSC84-like protein 1